ncbi:MAG: amino acid permease [Myxococcaceae bacterium]
MPGKHLGQWSGVGLVIANMVGAGVFISAGFSAQSMRPGHILLAWLAGAVLALCGSKAYAEVARLVPRSGGEYRYLSTLLHPSLGYLAGWASFLVGFSAPIAIDALAAGEFARQLFGVPALGTAVLLIAGLGALHASGLEQSAKGQNVLIAIKVLLLLFFTGTGLLLGSHSWPTWTPPHVSEGFPTGSFVNSLFYIAFAFSGWNAAIYASEEFDEPTKTVPRAMIIGCALVAVLYLLLNFVFVANLDPKTAEVVFAFDAPNSAKVTLGHEVMKKLLGAGAANVMSGIILLAFISAMSAMTLVGPRVYAAMANDGFLPKALGTVDGHPPRFSVLLQSALAILLVFITNLQQVLKDVGAILSFFAALTMCGLFRAALSNVTPEKPRPLALLAAFVYAGSTVFMLYTSIDGWLHPQFGEAHPYYLIYIAVVAVVALVAWGVTKMMNAPKGAPGK